MLNKKRLLLFMICAALLVGLYGCEKESENYVEVKEMLENVKFDWGVGFFPVRLLFVDTESKTYKFYMSDLEFYVSTTDGSYLIYEADSNGEIYNSKIYLSKADIKKYSKGYVEKYGGNFKIIENSSVEQGTDE